MNQIWECCGQGFELPENVIQILAVAIGGVLLRVERPLIFGLSQDAVRNQLEAACRSIRCLR